MDWLMIFLPHRQKKRRMKASKNTGFLEQQQLDLLDYAKNIRFDGADYVPAIDDVRLTGQIRRIFDSMKDARWRTLGEIKAITGDPEASISAQLRHLRKERFGEHTVNRRSRYDRAKGLYEYQLIVNNKCPCNLIR